MQVQSCNEQPVAINKKAARCGAALRLFVAEPIRVKKALQND
jgi:hypothetical protein